MGLSAKPYPGCTARKLSPSPEALRPCNLTRAMRIR